MVFYVLNQGRSQSEAHGGHGPSQLLKFTYKIFVVRIKILINFSFRRAKLIFFKKIKLVFQSFSKPLDLSRSALIVLLLFKHTVTTITSNEWPMNLINFFIYYSKQRSRISHYFNVVSEEEITDLILACCKYV